MDYNKQPEGNETWTYSVSRIDNGQVEERTLEMDGYIPAQDVAGPFGFFYDHCFREKKENQEGIRDPKYNSTIIGYVKTGASIEDDILAQLQSLIDFHKEVRAGTTVDMTEILKVDGVDFTEFQVSPDTLNDLDAKYVEFTTKQFKLKDMKKPKSVENAE